MTSNIAAVAVGVVLALFGVLGGVSAMSSSANSQAQTEAVVVYDGQ